MSVMELDFEPKEKEVCIQPSSIIHPKPILKWAGGKTQLIPELVARMPRNYNKYIEPFFGGGALFFNVRPCNPPIYNRS